MAIKLQSTSQIGLNHGIKCCIYGQAGAGKTRLLASAPKPIILSAESGLLSLRHYNLPYINVSSFTDMTEAYAWAMSSKEANQFDTICLDSISEIGEIVLGAEKKRTSDGRKAYGELNDKLMQMFRDFRDISKKHVVFTAKQEFDMIFRPSMPGKSLTNSLPYMFDEIWQLVRFPVAGSKDTFALRTTTDGSQEAKDRSSALEPWENADPETGGGLTTLFNKILGAV